jgi:hypothetical protein
MKKFLHLDCCAGRVAFCGLGGMIRWPPSFPLCGRRPFRARRRRALRLEDVGTPHFQEQLLTGYVI